MKNKRAKNWIKRFNQKHKKDNKEKFRAWLNA